jgi:hypothetical protein
MSPLRRGAAALALWGILQACGSSDGGSPAATGAGGSEAGGAGGTGGSALADCKAACDVVDGLHCAKNKAGDCGHLCDQTTLAAGCSAEFAAYSACARAGAWACASDLATLTGCDDPLAALSACLKTKGPGTRNDAATFACDKISCDGAKGEHACCLKLDLMSFSVVPRCTAKLSDCGQDSSWECDSADDCNGGACCWQQISMGMGSTILGTCRASCPPGIEEVCQGAGENGCTGGRYCCQPAGESVGTCAATQADCKPTSPTMQ